MQELLEQLRTERNICISQHNWSEALKIIDKMIAIKPTASFYTRRAMMLVKLKDYQLSIKNLQQALELDPNYTRAKNLMKKLENKIQEVWKDSDPAFADIKRAKNTSLSDVTPNSSTKDFLKVVKKSPSELFAQEGDDLIQLFKKSDSEKKQFGRYQIVVELGHGGMGKVYKAYDDQLGRYIALKVIISGDTANKKEISRFLREAKATAQLNHPNIVKVYDIGVENGAPYFTMDLIQGMSLKEHLQTVPRNILKIIRMMIKVGEAIHYAHQQKIIHRDIKPANIMISKHEEPLVMDFGLAKVVNDEQLSKTGDVIGTPAYMSPEQAQGKDVDKASDVYALGATLYEVLTGRPPFQGEIYFNIVKQILQDDPISPRVLNPEVPGELEAICLKCLEKNPEKRYRDAMQLTKDMSNFLENKPIVAKQYTIITHILKFIARHRTFTISATIVFLAVFIGGGFSFAQWQVAKKALNKEKIAKKRAIISQKKEESAKKEANATEKTARMNLAIIAIQRAREAKRWEACGAIAGAGLEYLLGLRGADVDKLRTILRNLIQLSLNQRRLIYQSSPGYTEIIKDIGYSPDGKIIASVAEDRKVCLWDAKSGLLIKTLLGHIDVINALSFAPNGKILATASKDRTVYVWDINKQKKSFVYRAHKDSVIAIAFDPDGKHLASASKDTTVKIWDLKGKTSANLAHPAAVTSLAFHPHRKILASAFDKSIYLWDVSLHKFTSLTENRAKVLTLAFHPDGKMLAAGCEDGTISIWDVAKKKISFVLKGHKSAIVDLKYSQKILASASSDTTINLWNDVYRKITTLKNYAKITAIAFSPDGATLASSTDDKFLYLWHTNSYKLKAFSGHEKHLTGVVYSPDGNKIITAVSNNRIRIYDSKTLSPVAVLAGHTDRVVDISCSSDSKKLVSASDDGTLRLWDLTTYTQISELKGHTKQPYVATFSPDGKKVVSGSLDKTIRLWDIATGRTIFTIKKHTGAITTIEYNPNGQNIVTTSNDKTVRLWDAKTGRELLKINAFSSRTTFSPKGDKFVFGAYDDHTIRLWDIAKKKQLATFTGHTYWLSDMAFSFDGQILASSACDKTVRLWDVASTDQIALLTGHMHYVGEIVISPDGQTLVSCSYDNTIALWELSVSKQLARISMPRAEHSVAYRPDGRELATISTDSKIRLWDPSTGKMTAELDKHSDSGSQIAYSRNGKIFASSAKDKKVYLWKAKSNELIAELAHKNKVRSVDFSPDNTTLATAAKNAYLWDLRTNKLLRELSGQRNVFSVKYSPDGKTLATGSFDDTIYLWDTVKNKPRKILYGHTDNVRALSYSPNGKILGSCSNDGTIRLWDVKTGDMLSVLKGKDIIRSLAFSPDGKILSGGESVARLWDMKTLKEIAILPRHSGTIYEMAYSPDSKILATVSSGPAMILWRLQQRNYIITQFTLPLWLRNMDPNVYINQKTYLHFSNTKIPPGLIEYALEKEPKRTTEFLFKIHVTKTLNIEDIPRQPKLFEEVIEKE